MPSSSPLKRLYVISDLHIGGEGILDKFESQQEFLAFIERIYTDLPAQSQAELIINGDFLGIWEFSRKSTAQKVKQVIKRHQPVFLALAKLSKKAKITLLLGNHDHEIAGCPECPTILKEWGIDLWSKPFLDREFLNRKVHIEHGNRFDYFNQIDSFGDSIDTPYAYHITKDFVIPVIKKKHPHHNWISDISFVNPTELVPYWFFSNYFYRELAPFLRYLIAPFFIFLTFSMALLVIAILNRIDLLDIPDIFYLTQYLGPIRYIANFIIIANFTFLVLFAVFSLVFTIFKRDLYKSLRRYGLKPKKSISKNFRINTHQKIVQFLKENPQYDLFIYGHTHIPALFQIQTNQQKTPVVVNSGCWTKTFSPVKSWFRLPSVYLPHFHPSYLILEEKAGNPLVSLRFISKKAVPSLTPLERFSIMFKKNHYQATPQDTSLNF